MTYRVIICIGQCGAAKYPWIFREGPLIQSSNPPPVYSLGCCDGVPEFMLQRGPAGTGAHPILIWTDITVPYPSVIALEPRFDVHLMVLLILG